MKFKFTARKESILAGSMAAALAFTGACAQTGPLSQPRLGVGSSNQRSDLVIDPEGTGHIESAGRARFFRYHDGAPDAGGPVPLVIVLHGGGGAAENVQRRYGFDSLADRMHFRVVYPDSQLDFPGSAERNWNDGRDVPLIRGDPDPVDDVQFIADIIESFTGSGLSDRRRVYLVGASNGGMLTLRFSCEKGNLLAGIGVVMASLPVDLADRCDESPPIPAIFIRGDADDTVPIEGGAVRSQRGVDRGRVVSMSRTMELWRERNGCSSETDERSIPDVSREDGTTAKRLDWKACKGAPLSYVVIARGGHQWPGVPVPSERVERSGRTNLDFQGSELLWSFFAVSASTPR